MKELIIIGIFVVTGGFSIWMSYDLFSWSGSELSAEYLSVAITALVGWVSYQVARSADKSSQIAVNLQKRAHELEERNESPYIVPISINHGDPYSHYHDSTDREPRTSQIWLVVGNLGNGPAFELSSNEIEIQGRGLRKNSVPAGFYLLSRCYARRSKQLSYATQIEWRDRL